jgi:raffinose/stachyose/melibiose transport system substrate-binding protein
MVEDDKYIHDSQALASPAIKERPRAKRRIALWKLTLSNVLLLAGWAVAAPQPAPPETITMWFWGASPAYREALDETLITPFNTGQHRYKLVVEYRATVDSDVRLAAIANRGPDLVYTAGPADVTLLAKAGKLAPLDEYAERYAWKRRLLAPVLDSCRQLGHLYCLPPSLTANGMYYNKRVLRENGWSVPTEVAALEAIMKAAQAKGLYASVTGNHGWQPINRDYASIFINQMVGPMKLRALLSGEGDWSSPQMRAAMTELDRWFKAGYLGGSDYFTIDFDTSLALLRRGRAAFFFAPAISYQWAVNYFTGDAADDLGFAAFPRMNPALPYPIYDIGSAFSFSINANSRVKDGAAMVLDRMLSPAFVVAISRKWPGYWAPPLVDFPDDPAATGIMRSFYDTMRAITQSVKSGTFGYNVISFFPPATKDVFTQDLEAVWLDQETVPEMLDKAGRRFAKERSRGLVTHVPAPPL